MYLYDGYICSWFSYFGVILIDITFTSFSLLSIIVLLIFSKVSIFVFLVIFVIITLNNIL